MRQLRTILVLCTALIGLSTLTACGFTPIYGKSANSESVRSTLAQIDIALIPDRDGQMLRNLLMDRFYTHGYPSNPRYRLQASRIDERRNDLDRTKTADATRRQIRLRVSFDLIDTDTGENVMHRNVTAVSSYNILESQFTTRVSERDAHDNAVQDLAEQIERHLALHFKE